MVSAVSNGMRATMAGERTDKRLGEQRRWDGEGRWDTRGGHTRGADGSKEGREGKIILGREGRGVLNMGMMELENG